MTPPCYPARPANGGPLETAVKLGMLNPMLYGDRRAEPKFNGWRALVHAPTGGMWNRHGEPLTIAHEFKDALGTLRESFKGGQEWFDCEPLSRRHGYLQGTLIVLDAIDVMFEGAQAPYLDRREYLALHIPRFDGVDVVERKPQAPVLLTPSYPLESSASLYALLQEHNRVLGLTGLNSFYEGIVLKDANSLYPCNKNNPERAFPAWTKHRFV